MTVLAIGDSFTFGAELPDVPAHLGFYGNDSYDKNTQSTSAVAPSQFAWPTLLANKLGTNCVNLGLVGGSNDRIFRLAVKNTVKEKYSLVVCAWTVVDRLDFRVNGKDLPITVSTVDSYKKKFPGIKEFVTNYYDQELAEEKWLTQVIALQAYFTSISQPYVFVKSLGTPVAPSNTFLNKRIDLKHCITWKSSMIDWCRDYPRGHGGHFLEEGHELVAEKIFKFLQEKEQCI